MMTFYTLDAEGVLIIEDADIYEYKNDDAATEALSSSLSDFRIERWTEGQYEDCWTKLPEEPEGCTPVVYQSKGMPDIPIHVSAPGSHPGGRSWWCRPAGKVMVPVLCEK